jgi:hypothetical protein
VVRGPCCGCNRRRAGWGGSGALWGPEWGDAREVVLAQHHADPQPKALEETSKTFVKEAVHLPTEPFTETEMLLQWNKYAQRLGDKGYKIMESLLLINDPVLNGTHITIELPNEGSKLDFESEKLCLLGYLKGHLHNHDITIEVIVNESFESKRSFNDLDRYNRLHQINPNIELLKSTFGLDIT